MTVRWDPFRDLISLQQNLNRIFDASVAQHRHEGGQAGWHPPADICETEKEIFLFVEIPGLLAEGFDLRVEGDRLTLRGERYRPQSGGEVYHQTEILMGPFHRTFVLPSLVDADNIQAAYTNGILEIVLPKRTEAPSRSVRIKVD
jgi:HSP20 family protein